LPAAWMRVGWDIRVGIPFMVSIGSCFDSSFEVSIPPPPDLLESGTYAGTGTKIFEVKELTSKIFWTKHLARFICKRYACARAEYMCSEIDGWRKVTCHSPEVRVTHSCESRYSRPKNVGR